MTSSPIDSWTVCEKESLKERNLLPISTQISQSAGNFSIQCDFRHIFPPCDNIFFLINYITLIDALSASFTDPSLNSTPIQTLWTGNSTSFSPVGHRKDDKWQDGAVLSRLVNNSSSMEPTTSSTNNYSRKSHSAYHGGKSSAGKFKKTDTPMLNLVYDSYIKLRHPDFRWVAAHVGGKEHTT